MKKVMIVQPYGYVSDSEYDRVKMNSIEYLTNLGYEVVNETKDLEWYTNKNMSDIGVRNPTLCQIAKSLETMSLCSAVYFNYNWDRTDHGMLMHEMARKFKLKLLYEGGEHNA